MTKKTGYEIYPNGKPDRWNVVNHDSGYHFGGLFGMTREVAEKLVTERTASRAASFDVAAEVRKALDEYEDGNANPPVARYAEFMEALAEEALTRPATFRRNSRQIVAEMFAPFGFVEYHTGGGCMALQRELSHGGYQLITDDDANIPLEHDGVILLGTYDEDGEEVPHDGATLTFASVAECLAHIKSSA